MKKGSVILTGIFVILCMLSVILLGVFAPCLSRWYVEWRGISPILVTVIPVTYYVCALPALVALACLGMLLRNILREHIFHAVNSRLMNVVALCCIVVAVACGVATYWYLPFVFVAAAMLFIFLIVRVVRGCFNAAITLREENDLTI